jgi:hypothetical protein
MELLVKPDILKSYIYIYIYIYIYGPKDVRKAVCNKTQIKTRWLYDVSTDLRKMGINERRDRARDREAWRRIVMEAKAHPRL